MQRFQTHGFFFGDSCTHPVINGLILRIPFSIWVNVGLLLSAGMWLLWRNRQSRTISNWGFLLAAVILLTIVIFGNAEKSKYLQLPDGKAVGCVARMLVSRPFRRAGKIGFGWRTKLTQVAQLWAFGPLWHSCFKARCLFSAGRMTGLV